MQPLDPQPSLVLFDLDDTLCDYSSARYERLKIAFSLALAAAGRSGEINLDLLVQESIAIQPHGIAHFRSLFASHEIDDLVAVAKAESWFVNHRFHELQLFPEALGTLKTVKSGLAHRRLGLVTNGPSEVQRAKIELLGLGPYFDFVVISDEVGVAKPDPAIFAEALRQGCSGPDESAFIGDSPEFDIAGAHNAGMTAIWLNHRREVWNAAYRPPDFVVSGFCGIERLLSVEGKQIQV